MPAQRRAALLQPDAGALSDRTRHHQPVAAHHDRRRSAGDSQRPACNESGATLAGAGAGTADVGWRTSSAIAATAATAPPSTRTEAPLRAHRTTDNG